MSRHPAAAAALNLVLLSPAALFMSSLLVRHLPLHDTATGAQTLVMWYAGRPWTLWLLLLALPFMVLTTGALVLSREWMGMKDGPRDALAPIRRKPAVLFLAGLTALAADILSTVVLHMVAN